jgi:hypothetical protein
MIASPLGQVKDRSEGEASSAGRGRDPASLRADRDSRARELPRQLLADYEKILKARSDL